MSLCKKHVVDQISSNFSLDYPTTYPIFAISTCPYIIINLVFFLKRFAYFNLMFILKEKCTYFS